MELEDGAEAAGFDLWTRRGGTSASEFLSIGSHAESSSLALPPPRVVWRALFPYQRGNLQLPSMYES